MTGRFRFTHRAQVGGKMKRFEIILTDPGEVETRTFVEECVTFAEAASRSYAARSRLGLDWKIVSIRQIGKEKKEENE